MASSASALLKVELQADGENDNTWGGKANDVFSRLEEAIAGVTDIVVTTADVTLTDTQFSANESRSAVISATGAKTADRSVIVPSREKVYIINNQTTGAFDLDVRTSGGTGPTIPQPGKALVYCDGTNVIGVFDTSTSVEILLDTTPQLGGALDTNAFAIDESEASAVASSGTTDIWATTGNTRHITGTTTITSLGTAPRAGAIRRTITDGALLFTNGANLILPGGQNITSAAGDAQIWYADTTSQIRCIGYTKADGKAVVESPETSEFAAGTRMVFNQTTAPTGWTKDSAATHNNASLRSTTGTVGTGGNDNFTTVFGTGKSTSSHTLTESQIPGHTHAAGTYAVGSHSHGTGTLAVASHTHAAGTYAVSNHNHAAGTLAGPSHTHADTLAAPAHTHTAGSYAGGAHRHGFRTNGVSTAVTWDDGANENILARTAAIFGVQTNSPQDSVDKLATTSDGGGTISGTSGGASATALTGSISAGGTEAVTGSTANTQPTLSGSSASTAPSLSGSTASTAPSFSGASASTGGGTGHTHSLTNLDVKYVDVIVASKD